MGKRTDTSGSGSLSRGLVTALSLLVVSSAAALNGVVVARDFGRSTETDGLLAAYGVFIVIVVAAQAIRVAVLPRLGRAALAGQLAGELAGYAAAVVVLAIPLVLAAELWANPIGDVLTGYQSDAAKQVAAEALRWMVPAAVLQLFAGLAASGLAALDDYGTAALGYAAGSIAGLALIVTRAEADGIVVVGWGAALYSAIALLVPASWLAIRALGSRMPPAAIRPRGRPFHARIGEFAVGAALPIALQLVYVVSLPFAAHVGAGATTTFVYGYLAAASVVNITAGSLGLVTAVPLARGDFSAVQTVRHVVSASWLALVIAGAAAGAFAVAGGRVVNAVLGSSYGGEVGADLGHLVVALTPWIVAAVGVAIAFPLAFVAGRTRGLPWIALGALALQIPLAWAGVRLLDLNGLALALACSTVVMLGALLMELGALIATARGVGAAAAVVAAITLAAFAPPAAILGGLGAGVLGLALYVALFALIRPRPLVVSWSYLRALR